jgi:lipopolysaccharide transport system ATP-binding protein
MKPIIEFQHVSKKFRIGAAQQPYLSVRDSLFNLFDFKKKQTEEFYALKDIHFNIEQGDTVGIIGKNGAGKSTLLKILSKITPPTSGQIITRGRIASLLEVGTGFHPELTGRDNVFMNGSILGMRKKEIERNFDAIVDFAGIEKFIDTPLKYYSSGMQLRLAFAVAAFLENEILVIDEVLAVGDMEFQKKCMGKMDDVSKSGRTVLFVSHNMGAVKHLCSKGLYLDKGESKALSDIHTAIAKYNETSSNANESEFLFDSDADKNVSVTVKGIAIKNQEGKGQAVFLAGDKFSITIQIKVLQQLKNTVVGIGFTSNEGAPIRTIWTKPAQFEIGEYTLTFTEDEIAYGTGILNLSIGIACNEINVWHKSDCASIVFENNFDKSIALRSDCGFILNQMNYHITKHG